MTGFLVWIETANGFVAGLCHILAMMVILVGVTKAFVIYLRDLFASEEARTAIQESRLEIGHSFSLALALLIGASILNTTLAPTWTDIGQLAAIIAIRTILNHFLLRDLTNHMPLAQETPAETPEEEGAALAEPEAKE